MTNQEYEAEIARLTQGYEDLKDWIYVNEYYEELDDGCTTPNIVNSRHIVSEINKITGGKK